METRIIKSLETLWSEYHLHRQEVLKQLEFYARETKYIQIYGVFLFGLFAFLFRIPGDPFVQVNSIPMTIRWFVLLIGAAITFYFFTAVMNSSYMFLILRTRMREIELKINEFLEKKDLLCYENKYTTYFLEQLYYAEGAVSPPFISAIFRFILFFLVVSVLSYLSGQVLKDGHAFVYSGTILFLAIFLIFEYCTLYMRSRRVQFQEVAIWEMKEKKRFSRLITYPTNLFFNYFVIIILFYFYIYSDVTDTYAIELISWLHSLAQYASYKIFMGVVAYTFSCAIIIPTPSEAPLLFIKSVNWLLIFTASGIGKGFGSLFLALLGVGIAKYLGRPKFITGFLEKRSRNNSWILKYSSVAYFLFQSIPFLPMRSSTLVYAWMGNLTGKRLLYIVLASGLGTFFRMALMYFLLVIGELSASDIFHIVQK